MRLGFAGTPEFAVPALEALHQAREVCAVFTQPDRPAGRGQPVHGSAVKSRAAELGIEVYQPLDFKSPGTLEMLRGLNLDVLVVVAYGLILPAAALQTPARGCINIHASLLPRWRGAAPIQRALLAGDTNTGITIMRMDEGLDTGPMLATCQMDIGAEDTAKTLHDRLAQRGAALIVDTLGRIEAGGVREVPQPSTGVTYAAKINKAEAVIDWREDATHIGRQVRAFNPWPIAETRLHGAQLRVWDAAVADSTAHGRAAPSVPGSVLAATQGGIDVACGHGVLRILRLQLAGRKALAARDFILGQPLDGERFAQT
jgi:methionyl-tRNA formyltransferase